MRPLGHESTANAVKPRAVALDAPLETLLSFRMFKGVPTYCRGGGAIFFLYYKGEYKEYQNPQN